MSESAALKQVISEVLEGMAMAFADDELGDDVAAPSEFHYVELDFFGPATGTLRLALEEEGLLEVAAGFLGLDPDDDETRESMFDVLGELGNVTLGNLLPAIAGEERVFNLSAPRVSEGKEEVWLELAKSENGVGLSVEGSALVANFDSPDLAQLDG